MRKRIISALLSLAMSVTSVMPCFDAKAENDNTIDNTVIDNQVDFKSENSFGQLMINEIESENNSESEDSSQTGCGISSVTVEGNIARIEFRGGTEATIIVGIYDDSGTELICSGYQTVDASASECEVEIQTVVMPEHFMIKCYMVDAFLNSPLCEVFQCPFYTEEWQEFFKLTANDFPEERVLNFDGDVETNFVVLKDDVTLIPEEEGYNKVISADNEDNVFVIENPSEEMLNLEEGQLAAYSYDTTGLLLIDVKELSMDDNTLTIYGNTPESDSFLEHVRIEQEKDLSDLENPEFADGWEYAEEDEKEPQPKIYPQPMRKESSKGYSKKIEIPIIEKEFPKDDDYSVSAKPLTTKGTIKINGNVAFELGVDIVWYKTGNTNYFSYLMKAALTTELSISGSAEIVLHLFPKNFRPQFALGYGAFLTLDPSIVLKVNAKIQLSMEASASQGTQYTKISGLPAQIDDISQSPQLIPTTECNISGSVFLGFDLRPTIKLIGEDLLSVKAKGTFGLLLSAKTSIFKNDEPEIEPDDVHICSFCIEGDLSVQFNLEVEFTEAVIFKQTFKPFKFTQKIMDWHYSDLEKKVNKGFCSNHYYKAQIAVEDEFSGKPIPGAIVSFLSDNVVVPYYNEVTPADQMITDDEGTVTFWMPLGSLKYQVSAEDYRHCQNMLFMKINKYGTVYTKSGNFIINNDLSTKIIQKLQPGVDDTEILVQDRYGQPIPYVVITPVKKDTFASSLNAGCYSTDKFGKATICGPAGEYLCKFERREFHTAEEKISIGKGEKNIITLYYVFEEMPDNPEDKPDNPEKNPDNPESVEKGTLGDSITWSIDSDGTLTISGTGYMYSYDDWGDTSPFYNNNKIKSVIIEDGILNIGNSMFVSCESLESITIPDSVMDIGVYAFKNCTSLKSIIIPDSVMYIGEFAFNGCSGLMSVKISSSVERIENDTFLECSSLTNIIIPDSVTSIGYMAFGYCESLASITIPESVSSIDARAFIETPWLDSKREEDTLVIENGILIDGRNCEGDVIVIADIKGIADSAFEKCSGITSITLPDSVTYIDEGAFRGCSNLTSVIIPDSVTYIGDVAFENCTSLIIINIPDSVTDIGLFAFAECTSLTSIIIPDSVTSIETSTFNHCSSLTSVEIPDSVTFIGDSAFFKCSSLESITIPDSVTYIGDSAFFECTSLTSIIIPDSVTSIGDWAFNHCSSLKSIVIPDSVTDIGSFAFAYCKSLTSITIPASVTEIEECAFEDCSSLKSIVIPASVTSIGDSAFSSIDGLEIKGYNNSCAQEYAEENGIEFVSLGDAPVSINSLRTSSLANDDEISVVDSQLKNSFILDSVDIMDDENDVNETEYTTYTFTDLLPNTMYNFYSVRSEQAENFFSVENLLYISQGISDDTGTLSFTYIPMFDDTDSVKLAVPISKNIAFASVTIPEMTYAGELLNVKPVVKLNGIILSEGTDYKLEGDTEISDSGYYVLDVVGIGEYDGFKSISYTVEGEESVILGDVDGDGQITAMDASAVLTYYVMNPVTIEDLGFPFDIKAADWDVNGIIDSRDASAILTYYVSH